MKPLLKVSFAIPTLRGSNKMSPAVGRVTPCAPWLVGVCGTRGASALPAVGINSFCYRLLMRAGFSGKGPRLCAQHQPQRLKKTNRSAYESTPTDVAIENSRLDPVSAG
jgi:hypothetical protein